MPTIPALGGDRYPNSARLSDAQTGDGLSTNVADRGAAIERAALLTITTAVGAEPACTYAVEGSADGTRWFPVLYADPATPETGSVATFFAVDGTVHKILLPGQPWRFLRLVYSANNNVTNTADLTVF
jgi:hypothetical protein